MLLGNSRYTLHTLEPQALTHFRAVTLAVTLRYILGFVTPVRRNINDKAFLLRRLYPDLPLSNAARSLLKTFCVWRIRFRTPQTPELELRRSADF